MSGQEERDVLFARLFGIAAVVRSGLLVRQTPLPSTLSHMPVSSLDTYTSLLTYLLEIGEAKLWLRESAWWTIGLAIDAVQASSVSWKVEALESAIKVVYSRNRDNFWTQDKVALTLKLQPLTPNHDWDETLAPVFKGRNIFAPNNLSSLGRILKVWSVMFAVVKSYSFACRNPLRTTKRLRTRALDRGNLNYTLHGTSYLIDCSLPPAQNTFYRALLANSSE